jgi:carboxypeptidase C (cathepsin A)
VIRTFAALLLLPALALAAPMRPEVVPPPEIPGPIVGPISTTHAGEFGGRKLRYTATFQERALSDANGRAVATLSATSYVVDGTSKDARPVLFAFNGGPGASSSPLHFGAFGPMRQERRADGTRAIVPNPASLLPLADLVFIDPVGTGFSRVLPGGTGKPFWTADGDARAVLDFIRDWLKTNGRMRSPVYVAGESYGGYRLATMAKFADDLPIAGLVLISPGFALTSLGDYSTDLPYVFDLPTMALAARFHGKGVADGRSAAQYFDDVAAFSQGEYVIALMQGSALPASERDRLAAKIAPMLGLPVETVASAGLRVDSETFLTTLLKGDGKLVGRLDARITGPIPTDVPKGRSGAMNDPALGLGRTNVIMSPAIAKYLRDDLKVPVDRDYVSLSLDVNFSWDWRADALGPAGAPNPVPNLAKLMKAQPQTKLLVVGGLYDLACTWLGVRYAITHSDVPLDRVTWARLEAGHSPFEGDTGLARMNEIFGAFVAVPSEAAKPRATRGKTRLHPAR